MRLCVSCLRCYEDDILACLDDTHEVLISPRSGSCIIDGKYRLIRMLERGGMGAVYEGTHLELDRRLAIKILVSDYVSADPHAPLRLRQEALTACKFDHPNLVRLYDFGTNPTAVKDQEQTHADEQYIVMELLQGQSLKEMLAQDKCVALSKAVAIAIQIAEGLAEIHSKGIIYRDLKPANVLICTDYKGDMVVKIVDFGAVKLRHDTSINGGLDLTKAMFVGSPIYASPENCKGEPLDERSDVYSLGLILYEMIAGFRAFEGDFLGLLNSHAYFSPPPLTGVPSSIADLVMSALRKDPNERPQTATEFAKQLLGLEFGNLPVRLRNENDEAGSRVTENEETVVTTRTAIHSLCDAPAKRSSRSKVSIPIPRAFSRFNLKRELTVAAIVSACFTQGDNLSRRLVRQNNVTVAVPAVSATEALASPLLSHELPIAQRSHVARVSSEPIFKSDATKSEDSHYSPPLPKPFKKPKTKTEPATRGSRGTRDRSSGSRNSRTRTVRGARSYQPQTGSHKRTRDQRKRGNTTQRSGRSNRRHR